MRWHAKSDPFHVEFLEPRRLLSLSVGGDSALSGCAYSVATADFNGDGQSDLATIAYPDAVAVMLANANGTFAAGQPLAAWSGPRSTPAT